MIAERHNITYRIRIRPTSFNNQIETIIFLLVLTLLIAGQGHSS